MSIGFNEWLGDANDLAALPTQIEASRAVAAWRRINDKPVSLAFRKPDGTTLDAQTVRLEWDTRASETESAAGEGAIRKLIIFGVRNHPTVTDTDIGEKYRVNYQNDAYTVIDIIYTLGEVQAIAEAIG